MAHAEKTLTINRPPNDVFDFILEGKNNPSLAAFGSGHSPTPRNPVGHWIGFQAGYEWSGRQKDRCRLQDRKVRSTPPD